MLIRKKKRAVIRSVGGLLCVTLLIGGIGWIGAKAEEVLGFPEDAVTTPIYYNGNEIPAGQALRVNGVTYVPFRNFCNCFGNGKISWNGLTGTASYQSDVLSIQATVGKYYICDNGHYDYTVGVVRNRLGTVYVPIRPMAKAFALNLSWNAEKAAVELTPNGTRRAVAWANYDAGEVYWLSRIIFSEAGAEAFRGQMAVGNVVLNRVRSADYPNTIYGVIFDRKYGIQFSPVANGSIYRTPSKESVIAAKICLEGYTLSDEILFFVNPKIATSSWIQQNRSYSFTVGNHLFYN